MFLVSLGSATAQWTTTVFGGSSSLLQAGKPGHQVGAVMIGPNGHAGYWTIPGSFVDLHPSGATGSLATATNGVQEGGSHAAAAYPFGHATLWSGTAGSMVDLNPAGYARSNVRAMSSTQQGGTAGATVGQTHAALWSGSAGSFVDFHPSGSYITSEIHAMSETHQGGYARLNSGGRRALLWNGAADNFVYLHADGPTSLVDSAVYAMTATQQGGSASTVSSSTAAERAAMWSGTAASRVDLHPAGASSSRVLAMAGSYQAGQVNDQAAVWQGSAASWVNLHALLLAQIGGNYTVSAVTGAYLDGGNIYLVGYAQDQVNGFTIAVMWSNPFPAPPVIILPPQSRSANAGTSITLSVTASGTAPLNYQWRKNGTNLPAPSQPTLALANLVEANSGSYDVVISNAVASIASPVATITVNPIPTGTLRNVVNPGDSLNLVLNPSVVGPPSYQWLHNFEVIPGATGTTLALSNVNYQSGGHYMLVITDNNGTRRSAPIFVLVAPATTAVLVWGSNSYGQAAVPVGLDAVAVSGGEGFALALRRDGTVAGWGRDNGGQATVPAGLSDVVAISTGATFGLALKTDGTVVQWGLHQSSLVPVPTGLAGVVAIAAGDIFALALKSDGSVVTWGASGGWSFGQPAPLTSIKAIGAGDGISLVLKNDGSVLAWGSAFNGNTTVPAGLTGVTGLSGGYDHVLALKTDGTVTGWGGADFGQLPVPPGLSGVRVVEAGYKYSLALKSDGTLQGWGDSSSAVQAIPAEATDIFAVSLGTRNAGDFAVAIKSVTMAPPIIVSNPAATSVPAGNSASFAIAATGLPAPSYQWQRLPAGSGTWADIENGGAYSGAGSATLLINDAALSMNDDQFRCVATNIHGTATSNPVTLTVTVPLPVITTQPASQAVAVGSPINLSVTASSPVAFTYQWRKNGTNIGGATSSTYTIASAQLSDAADYTVVVTNSAGSVTSNAAAVVVATSPIINTHPATQAVYAGQPASFTVAATSAAPLSYVWRKNGTPIGGATTATYTIAATQLSDAADYSVVVTNVAGSVTSNDATLTINIAPPVITAHPANRLITQGATAQFSITATGSPAPTYQWQVLPAGGGSWGNTADGATYGGSQTATLTVSGATAAVNNGDQYRCVATNAGGSVTSNAASLSVTVNPAPIAVAAGGTFTTYLRFDGSLFGTGTNAEGQLGDGSTTNRTAPVALATGVAAAAAGTDHQLLLKADGSLWVNGYNPFGALGTNDTASRTTPVQIATGVAGIAAGHRHSLFFKNDGTLWAMGWNSTGQLGDGTTTNRLTPVQVAANVIAVAGGVSHSLFLKSNGTAWAMGDNSLGQLGDGTTTNRSTPVQIATGVANISAGGYFNLLLKTDGTLWAAGFNGFGQLGDGTTTNRPAPVQVATGVRAMSGGFHHGMYLKTDGTLWSAGYNDFGQIGDGSTTHRSVPFQLATSVTGLSAGRYQGAFIKSDGSLWVVGGNNFGQLGDGTTTNHLTPVQLTAGTVSLPALVTDLTATELVNSDRVALSWNAAVGATYYEVWRSTTAQSGDAVRIATQLPGTFFEDVTATTGVLYRYWIRSANGAGVTGFGSSDAGSYGVILVAPTITVPPASQTVNVGANVTFSVTAAGTAPFTYQWRKGTNPIGGATASSHAITGATTTDAGSYDVVVTNGAGSVTSAAATLTVNKLAQTITFDAPADRAYSPLPFGLVATSDSGLPVTFSILSGPATIDGSDLTLTGVGTVTVRAGQGGNGSYLAATNVDRSFVVSQAVATVTLGDLAATYDGTAKSATATTSPAGLNVVLTYDGGATAPTNAGSYTVVGTINEANYQGSAVDTLVIAKAAQTITFAGPASQTYSATPIALSATADSGLPVSFTIVSGPATISGSNLTLTGTGSVTVRASQAGDSNRLAAPSVDRSFNSNKLSQTITFAPLADRAYTTVPQSLAATASSGLPVSFSLVSGPATLNGSDLTITGVGTVTVRADQAGNSFYLAAANLDRSFVVSKAVATVTLGDLAAIYDGTAKSVTAVTAPAGLVVDFTYDGGAPAPTDAGSYAIVGTVNEANYQGSANDTLVIAKADQTVTFAGPANQPYSAAPITLSATASSGLAVTFSVVSGPATVAGDSLTLTGAGAVTVRATQDGDANRNAAPEIDRSFTVTANLASWQLGKFTASELLDVNISGPNADPDHDGFANLLEYALGFEPKSATTTGLPQVGTEASDWAYTYTRPADRTDVTFVVEMSTNLTDWGTAGVTHVLVSSSGGNETWRAKYPLVSAANVFFRLKVTGQ